MPKYFTFGGANINGIVFLIPNSTSSFLVYWKATEFCVLTLYLSHTFRFQESNYDASWWEFELFLYGAHNFLDLQVSFAKLGTFSAITSLKLSTPLSFLSGTPVIQMLDLSPHRSFCQVYFLSIV